MPIARRALPWLACLITIPLAARQATAPQKTLSNFDRSASLTMLANVKADLKENYYDKTFHGIGVDAAFAEAEKRVKGANSLNDTVALIADVLEHVGVTPDEIVLPTAADLAAGRDPALARAVVKLGGTITPAQAGKLLR